mmetsp:Transcript_1232/g.2162  ORF Transcript_1232/g.2162 Transcript_1232/m.2162 type:complete len:181 (+) Transcript_1232:742-1284(+)
MEGAVVVAVAEMGHSAEEERPAAGGGVDTHEEQAALDAEAQEDGGAAAAADGSGASAHAAAQAVGGAVGDGADVRYDVGSEAKAAAAAADAAAVAMDGAVAKTGGCAWEELGSERGEAGSGCGFDGVDEEEGLGGVAQDWELGMGLLEVLVVAGSCSEGGGVGLAVAGEGVEAVGWLLGR